MVLHAAFCLLLWCPRLLVLAVLNSWFGSLFACFVVIIVQSTLHGFRSVLVLVQFSWNLRSFHSNMLPLVVLLFLLNHWGMPMGRTATVKYEIHVSLKCAACCLFLLWQHIWQHILVDLMLSNMNLKYGTTYAVKWIHSSFCLFLFWHASMLQIERLKYWIWLWAVTEFATHWLCGYELWLWAYDAVWDGVVRRISDFLPDVDNC